MQYQTNAEQQNKEENSLAENKFLTETSRGDKVLSIAQDRSGRNVAVVQRKNDFTVAIGYDTTDGTWAQGVYDFKDENAANDYREKYYGENSEPQEKWYEIFVSKDALIKRYNKSSLMRMPSSNKEYADYSYYIFNNRIKESRQLSYLSSTIFSFNSCSPPHPANIDSAKQNTMTIDKNKDFFFMAINHPFTAPPVTPST